MVRVVRIVRVVGVVKVVKVVKVVRVVKSKDRTGRVGSGRTDRHTPVSATGRPPSLCRPRPTYDVTAGHVLTLALQMYIQKDEEAILIGS